MDSGIRRMVIVLMISNSIFFTECRYDCRKWKRTNVYGVTSSNSTFVQCYVKKSASWFKGQQIENHELVPSVAVIDLFLSFCNN
jgi:hypothetical protein